jgi:hypothetical protein
MKPVLMWHHLQLMTLWNMVLNTSNSHLLQKELVRGMMTLAQDGNWAFFFPFYLNNDSLCTYLFILFLCDTVAAAESRTRALKDYEWFSVKFAAYNCFSLVFLVGNNNHFRSFYVTVRTTYALSTLYSPFIWVESMLIIILKNYFWYEYIKNILKIYKNNSKWCFLKF